MKGHICSSVLPRIWILLLGFSRSFGFALVNSYYLYISTNMNIFNSIECLSALAQETRLEAFRLLVRMGDVGLPAGKIASHLSVNVTTLSRHLAVMEQAGLLSKERQARQIIYRVSFSQVRDLFSYLIEDCCAGDPRVTSCCAPAGAKQEES